MAEVFVNIGNSILLLNLILFIKGFSCNGKAFKIFTVYTAVITVIQIIGNILNYYAIYNLWLSHFYFILQFIILSIFYIIILKDDFQKELVKLGLVIAGFTLGIQYAFHTELFYKFNLFEIFLTSYLLIIYSTFHFYNLLSVKREFYYINMGILIYLFGSTILFLTGNLMTLLSSKMNKWSWLLNAILYIVYQCFVLFEWKKNYAFKKL